MTLQQVIDISVSGELKNLAVKSDTVSIINYINMGMIELYKRFPLNIKEHIIDLEDGVDIYTLPSDCMWITKVYDEVPENSDAIVVEVPVNEEDNPLSVNTISWNQLQVPMSITGAHISVIYTAAPKWYTVDDLGEDIAIPPQMIESLLLYVGYRAHSSVTSTENGEHNVHYSRFEASVSRIQIMGMLTSDDVSMKGRVVNKGFL